MLGRAADGEWRMWPAGVGMTRRLSGGQTVGDSVGK
jgi:hypothetical protein